MQQTSQQKDVIVLMVSVNELQKIAGDQVANVATAERFDNSSNDRSPDPNLVHRLIERGYSENAAKKAVFMTGNTGYNEALGWAVTHTLDPNFNEPIVFVRDPRKMYIDEAGIQLLQKTLHATQRWIDDDKAKESLVAFLKYLDEGTPLAAIETPTKPKAKPPRKKSTPKRSKAIPLRAERPQPAKAGAIGEKATVPEPLAPTQEPTTALPVRYAACLNRWGVTNWVLHTCRTTTKTTLLLLPIGLKVLTGVPTQTEFRFTQVMI